MIKRIFSASVLAIVAVFVLNACSTWSAIPVGYSPGGMMGNGGMMSGGGMMGSSGMMNGYGYNPSAPAIASTPIGATAEPVDREILISAANFRFAPDQVIVKPGEKVRFVIANQDNALHNFVVQDAGLPYFPLPAGATQSIVWTAPAKASIYTAACTFHAGMSMSIVVKD